MSISYCLITAAGICDHHAFGHCYKYFDSVMPFEGANTLCRNSDDPGYILEINSAEENEFALMIRNGIFFALSSKGF